MSPMPINREKMRWVPPTQVVAVDVFGDERETRSFQLFCERTKIELSGFYDAFFWNHLVLQASRSKSAIKHVLVALGSLHDCLQLASIVDGQTFTNKV